MMTSKMLLLLLLMMMMMIMMLAIMLSLMHGVIEQLQQMTGYRVSLVRQQQQQSDWASQRVSDVRRSVRLPACITY